MVKKEPKFTYPETFKSYIENLGFICRRATFHGEYDVNYIFCEDDLETDSEASTVTYMTIHINSVYLYATVRIYPSCLEKYQQKRFDQLGEFMLHEFCHMFTEPLIEQMRQVLSENTVSSFQHTVERQTQRICNSVVAGFPDNWFMPKEVSKSVK